MTKKLLLIILFLVLSVNSFAQIVYVKQNATGLNNGSSWQDAFTDLSTAINTTATGEIWVTAGTYFPSTDVNEEIPQDPRFKTFKLKKNIAIYGGFSGVETNLKQRDWVANPTILSGEIGNPNDLKDNLIHVITCEYVNIDKNTILDGLTITKGYAQSNSGALNGGGLYIFQTSGGSFTMRNCIIKENYSEGSGGGMYIQNCDPLIENCTFISNAAYSGGAMILHYSHATIRENEFSNNIATGHALHWGEGGAIQIEAYSSPKILSNSFTNNYAQYKGGCLINSSNYDLTFFNNIVSGNRSRNGGAVYLNGTSYLINNVFHSNTARWYGGAIYMDYSGYGKFFNNTVVNNSAETAGGGLYIFKPSHEIYNSIFWNNVSPLGSQIKTFNTVLDWTQTIQNCNIQGGLLNVHSEGNPIIYKDNLNVDPLFADLLSNDFKLQTNSPLINAGNNSIFPLSWKGILGETINFPTKDVGGYQRIIGTIDIGAYEFGSTLGIASQIENNNFSIYPNPSNGIFNFKSTEDLESISVSTIQGQTLFKNSKAHGLKSINLTGYPTGLYFINFTIGGKTYSQKIIIK